MHVNKNVNAAFMADCWGYADQMFGMAAGDQWVLRAKSARGQSGYYCPQAPAPCRFWLPSCRAIAEGVRRGPGEIGIGAARFCAVDGRTFAINGVTSGDGCRIGQANPIRSASIRAKVGLTDYRGRPMLARRWRPLLRAAPSLPRITSGGGAARPGPGGRAVRPAPRARRPGCRRACGRALRTA